MLNANKLCLLYLINVKNQAKTSLPGNHYVNKWGVAYCVGAVMVMIHNYYNNTLQPETSVDIQLGP